MAPIYAIEYVQNQAGKIRSMTGGQASMPFVLWLDGAGRQRGSAGQHTDVGMEALYAQLPGIKVVAPSNAYDAKGLLIAAIRDADPVVYLDYGEVKGGDQPDVPDEAYEVPLGKADRPAAGQGSHDRGMGAGDRRREEGAAGDRQGRASASSSSIRASLKPLDVDTLVASASKTRRLLVVEHGHYTAGFGSHVIAEVVQEVPGVKVRKLAFPTCRVPAPPDDVLAAARRAEDRRCGHPDDEGLGTDACRAQG